jgi:hypothetical protein
MADTCRHWEGDTINGYWLCAACYTKVAERPRRYFRPIVGFDPDGRIPAQEIILAPIATHESVTLGQFLKKMASRLIAITRGSMTVDDATDYAIDLLRGFDEKFGDPSMCWDASGAWEIVDEDLQYWDADESATN